ncbi:MULTISPECIES: hypothetical protein [unclassified Gordonia (in: high G+C Gram-positive bacteria)]|uniref:hypothetical protein n=1 Tax=unclassified Gordonia (in: high G+C Gram-positive bacteria) TaxID=2657482 RepID=UPI001F0EF803|nr:hypothetical protein [Gordonia sp. ABSL49_1]MCH5642485.1 hypothetical protein [Gordonia sp. ABSL49_1]
MLAAVVFEPSAPLLVPEVAGPAATDTVAVRAAAVSALASATTGCDKWIALGATDCGGSGQMPTPSEVGTFARFGVDVSVTLTAGRTDPHAVDPEMSLSMLVAAWLRGQSGIDRCRPVLVGADTSAAGCAVVGRGLATEIAASDERFGVLVVGDGATALSAKAPGGGLRESAVVLQKVIDEAMAGPEPERLAALSEPECEAEGVAGRVAWQVAAALCTGLAVRSEVLYADAPFGVGYTVARWIPEGAR